jgi:hypothetical protein
MKKFILVGFAFLFSVSVSFAYRTFISIQTNGKTYYYCTAFGGTCLPTVIVTPQQ